MICSSRRLSYPRFLRGVCRCLCFREHLQFSLDCLFFFPSSWYYWCWQNSANVLGSWWTGGTAVSLGQGWRLFFPLRKTFVSFRAEAVWSFSNHTGLLVTLVFSISSFPEIELYLCKISKDNDLHYCLQTAVTNPGNYLRVVPVEIGFFGGQISFFTCCIQ